MLSSFLKTISQAHLDAVFDRHFDCVNNESVNIQSTNQYACIVFSSPEPKAHGELIVYQSIRRLSGCVCVCVCVSVNIFKLEYLRNQWAKCNEILSEPSLGLGKGCIRFWSRPDRNSGFYGNG